MTRGMVFLALVAALALPVAALAQDVGAVASAAGQAELGRDGAWSPAEAGMGVRLGDQLKTGNGQLKVVFQDESVLNLAENTVITVDDQVFQPQEGTFKSLMKLMRGKVRATVGSYYQQSGANYEVETPTAVAGVRGTTFLVSYDEADEVTQVVGIHGRVHVRGLDERIGEGVYVTAHEATEVGAGEPATRPQRLDEDIFHQRLEGVELLGLPGTSRLAGTLALQSGETVPAPDRAPIATSRKTANDFDDLRDPSDVTGQPLGVVSTTRGRLGVPF